MRNMEWILIFALLAEICSPFILRTPLSRWLLSAFVAVLAIFCGLMYGVRFAMLPAYLLAGFLLLFQTVGLRRKERKKRPLLRGIGIGALCLFYILVCGLPFLLPIADLPKPSGESPIGSVRADIVDSGRKDMFTGIISDRKLALQIWYPASDTQGCQRAVWMDREAARLCASNMGLPDIFGQFSLVKTNSYWNAPISGSQEKYPVLLFSGGFGGISSQNTIQMEELASRGYIVCAVSHPGDEFATVYADGAVEPSNGRLAKIIPAEAEQAYAQAEQRVADKQSPEFQREVLSGCTQMIQAVRVWSRDLIAAANYLETLNTDNVGAWKNRLDMERLGAFGHSFGGAASGDACRQDDRFKAFVNMDGAPCFGDAQAHIIQQPFLVMMSGKASEATLQGGGYAREQTNFLVLGIKDALHLNFTDLNITLSRYGKLGGILGPIDGTRQTHIVNTYLNAFFDHYLNGREEPLLEASVSEFPEVTIIRK